MSKPSDSSSFDKAKKYDPQYDDPAADVVLRSTSGTLFRVSSWYLAKHSTFFADLREVASPVAASEEPISTDLDDATIKILLQPFYPPNTACFSSLAFPSIRAVFGARTFLDKYLFEKSKIEINRNIEKCAKADPWAYFLYAGEERNITIGKMAIDHMTPLTLNRPKFWQDIRVLPSNWQLALIHAIFDGSTGLMQGPYLATHVKGVFSARFEAELIPSRSNRPAAGRRVKAKRRPMRNKSGDTVEPRYDFLNMDSDIDPPSDFDDLAIITPGAVLKQ